MKHFLQALMMSALVLLPAWACAGHQTEQRAGAPGLTSVIASP
ncbi:hypothetical protein [Chitinimonas naiadis]